MISSLILAHCASLGLASGPVDSKTKVRFGKYEATLRIPEEGLYAQEETDVEFRVVDTTQKDPVEVGFKGVGAIDASATMTMPAMAGMPVVKPSVHREGVPGDYGLVLFFAHGGEYEIDLKLAIPDGGVKNISFMVDVKDERPAHTKKAMPFRMDLVDFPKNAQAGNPVALKLRIIDTKTNKVETSFDEAHERKFHLLIASSDLNWFRHEHPEMNADGTWSISQVFPAGGDYWVYGDVAPAGQGSRILISKVHVAGPKPTWNTKLVVQSISRDNDLQGAIDSLKPMVIGRTVTIRIRLFSGKNSAPTPITDKYLGAIGHLMIFSKDGQTAVHSHPMEDKMSDALAKRGIVNFSARFPKPGLYKAYAQFNYHGSVHTLGFGIQVKP